jgi:hypothetical protein
VPIIVSPPDPPGSPIGPGAPIAISSDITVDPTDTCHFLVILRRFSSTGNIFHYYQLPCEANNTTHILMTQPSIPITTQITYPRSDDTVWVDIQQVINGVVAGQGLLQALWDNQAYLGNQIANMQTQVQGGFTDTDREQLQLAVDNTTTSIPAAVVGGLANAGLGRLFDQVPPALLARHGNSIHLTGNGSLTAGVEPFATYALGIEWIFDTPPAGFGLERGNVTEFEPRMVQWMPVYHDRNGSAYWANLVDAHEAGQRLLWGTTVPANLNYWIAPGLGLTVTFLTFVATP